MTESTHLVIAVNHLIDGVVNPMHTSEWIAGISGIGGVVIGNLVAISMAEYLNARHRAKDQREKLAAAAFSAYQRLNQIYTVSTIVRSHLIEGAAIAEKNEMDVCLATRPMQRISFPVNFPMDELWAITKIGGANAINKLNSLDHVFNMLIESMDGYSTKRQELTKLMPPPASLQGDHGTLFPTADEAAGLRPILADLNTRLEKLLPIAQKIVEDCFHALIFIATEDSKLLGSKFEMQLPDPKGNLVKFGAQIKTPTLVSAS